GGEVRGFTKINHGLGEAGHVFPLDAELTCGLRDRRNLLMRRGQRGGKLPQLTFKGSHLRSGPVHRLRDTGPLRLPIHRSLTGQGERSSTSRTELEQTTAGLRPCSLGTAALIGNLPCRNLSLLQLRDHVRRFSVQPDGDGTDSHRKSPPSRFEDASERVENARLGVLHLLGDLRDLLAARTLMLDDLERFLRVDLVAAGGAPFRLVRLMHQNDGLVATRQLVPCGGGESPRLHGLEFTPGASQPFAEVFPRGTKGAASLAVAKWRAATPIWLTSPSVQRSAIWSHDKPRSIHVSPSSTSARR